MRRFTTCEDDFESQNKEPASTSGSLRPAKGLFTSSQHNPKKRLPECDNAVRRLAPRHTARTL